MTLARVDAYLDTTLARLSAGWPEAARQVSVRSRTGGSAGRIYLDATGADHIRPKKHRQVSGRRPAAWLSV